MDLHIFHHSIVPLHAEIRDNAGSVESATIKSTPAQVFNWYEEHGIQVSDIQFDEKIDSYTFTRQ